eukprot:IDg10629t1
MKLGEKLKLLHLIDKDHSLLQDSKKYGISKRTVERILGARATLIEMDKSGVPRNTCGPLKAQYTEIEQAVSGFIGFVRSQRLPAAMSLIQERARLSAEQLRVVLFKESCGWYRNKFDVQVYSWHSSYTLKVYLLYRPITRHE